MHRAPACFCKRGYAQASVAEVEKRAGVSSPTFYKQFGGMEDCMLALVGKLAAAE